MTIPKPKYCGQNWLEMKSATGGRICGKCEKLISDFSKLSWAEIEVIQKQNNNSLCGMYSSKQIEYWGNEVPPKNPYKYLSTAALLFSLTTSNNSIAQVTTNSDSIPKTIIKGFVTGRSQEENIDTLHYAYIWLKNSKIGTVTDEHGRYQLDITESIDTMENPTIVLSYIGYTTIELQLNPESKGEINFDAQLEESLIIDTVYYASKPTLWQSIKWGFRDLFHHKDK